MKVLLAGWFSFERMGATAGDLLSRDVVAFWLREAGVPVDIAAVPPFEGDLDWRKSNPMDYSHVIFVCGPFGNGEPITGFLNHFSNCKRIGMNLSMLQSLSEWHPFDLLLERDSSRTIRPDLSFLSISPKVPVVGLVLVHPQTEYRDRSQHDRVHQMIHSFLRSVDAAIVPIDTRLDENSTGLRTPAEVESLIARMDVIVTTRLHGTVLALKNGVPALAVDPISGGAKIAAQARTLGWPTIIQSDDISVQTLRMAFDYCLTSEAKTLASRCAARAEDSLQMTKREFLAFLESARTVENS